MLALGMVVVTVLIGAPGLGVPIIRALENTNVGAAFDAGIAIVILAIVIDRITEHWSSSMDARRPVDEVADRRRRRMRIAAVAIAGIAVVVGAVAVDAKPFPSAISVSFEDPINAISDWIKTNAFAVTDFLKNTFSELILNLLQTVPDDVAVVARRRASCSSAGRWSAAGGRRRPRRSACCSWLGSACGSTAWRRSRRSSSRPP
jgi:glycine betaine/proline transport system permease protein